METIIYLLFGWNLITFLLMGIDKYQAIRNRWRISEMTLLTVAFFMGAFGSVGGSLVFRHKTKTWKFRVLLPIALLFNVSVIFLIRYYIL